MSAQRSAKQHPVWPSYSHVLRASAPAPNDHAGGCEGPSEPWQSSPSPCLSFPSHGGPRAPGASHSLTVEGQNSSLLGPNA